MYMYKSMYMKTCLTSLIIRELQDQTTYYLIHTHIRTKKTKDNKSWYKCGEN